MIVSCVGAVRPLETVAPLSGAVLNDVRQSCSDSTTEPLPGAFIGLGLDLKSDKLYDLGGAIPDVIGLQVIQPRAAVVKVMSVPDSRCVRVVVPGDHLSNRFHEILIHDMDDEEPPFVALSGLA